MWDRDGVGTESGSHAPEVGPQGKYEVMLGRSPSDGSPPAALEVTTPEMSPSVR